MAEMLGRFLRGLCLFYPANEGRRIHHRGGTYSNDGNVDGFHGQQDAWIVKLNPDGDKPSGGDEPGGGCDAGLGVGALILVTGLLVGKGKRR